MGPQIKTPEAKKTTTKNKKSTGHSKNECGEIFLGKNLYFVCFINCL